MSIRYASSDIVDAIFMHEYNERMKYEWSEEDGVFQTDGKPFKVICKRRMHDKYMISARSGRRSYGDWFKDSAVGSLAECCEHMLTKLHEREMELEYEMQRAKEMIDFFSEAMTGNGELGDAVFNDKMDKSDGNS